MACLRPRSRPRCRPPRADPTPWRPRGCCAASSHRAALALLSYTSYDSEATRAASLVYSNAICLGLQVGTRATLKSSSVLDAADSAVTSKIRSSNCEAVSRGPRELASGAAAVSGSTLRIDW